MYHYATNLSIQTLPQNKIPKYYPNITKNGAGSVRLCLIVLFLVGKSVLLYMRYWLMRHNRLVLNLIRGGVIYIVDEVV